jgi:nitrogen fixation protein FixH
VVAVASDFATTVRVRLTAAPGMPGPNIFKVRVQDYDTGEPVPARLVTLRFSLPGRPDVGASELPLAPVAPGLWEARGTNLSVPGTWRVGVLVQEAADSLEIPVALATRPPPQRVDVSEGGPGAPDLYTIHVGQGRSVQGYLDPGTPGPNELHFTFFDPGGGELPVEEARVEAVSPSGRVIPLEARRLDRGHFAAAVNLEPGRWRFRSEATAGDGTVVTAYFDQEVER